MSKSNDIGGIILAAAAALAIYKLFSMPREERNSLFNDIKSQTRGLIEDADNTVEKIQQYVGQMKSKRPEDLIDKLFIIKNMFEDLYGNKPNYATNQTFENREG